MTSSLRLPFYYLWIAPHALQVIILVLLVWRGFYKKFPVFTAYTAASFCKFITLFIVSKSLLAHTTYFQCYSFGVGIITALRFGVICEIFAHVFANYAAVRSAQRPLFRWTAVAFLTVAFSFAIYTHRFDTDPTWFALHVLERSANIVECGLILALFLFSAYLGLLWSRLAFGIALGFGVLCSLELALAAVRSQIGLSAHVTLDLFDMATYHCCVLIWLFYLIIPERKPLHIPDNIPDNDLESWNNELETLLTR